MHSHLFASSDCKKFNSSHAASLILLTVSITPCVTSSQMPLTNDFLLRVLVLTCVDGFHQNFKRSWGQLFLRHRHLLVDAPLLHPHRAECIQQYLQCHFALHLTNSPNTKTCTIMLHRQMLFCLHSLLQATANKNISRSCSHLDLHLTNNHDM